MGHCILPTKGAVLAFARQHRLRPPSWCSDAPKAVSQPSPSPEELQPAPTPTYTRGSQPSRSSEDLKPASQAKIIEEIRSEYAAAKAAGRKAPNLKEVQAPVQLRLKQKGFFASQLHILHLAKDEEFKKLRRPRGKTVKSERPK
jgi:hypothetical protein